MSLLDRDINIRIIDIKHLYNEKSSVIVAPRPYHALAFRQGGRVDFSAGEVFSAECGSVAYIPANLEYGADYTEVNEIYVIHFDADIESGIEIYRPLSAGNMYNLFMEAYLVWKSGGVSHYYRAMSLFYEILGDIAEQADSFSKRGLYKSFYTAVDYMKKNYRDGDFSIEELFKMSNMSDTYFRKLFREIFGETPSEHLTKLRLGYAEKLLSKGTMTVNEVAYMSGFNDPKYFSRVVKKVYGCSPSKIFVHK